MTKYFIDDNNPSITYVYKGNPSDLVVQSGLKEIKGEIVIEAINHNRITYRDIAMGNHTTEKKPVGYAKLVLPLHNNDWGMENAMNIGDDWFLVERPFFDKEEVFDTTEVLNRLGISLDGQFTETNNFILEPVEEGVPYLRSVRLLITSNENILENSRPSEKETCLKTHGEYKTYVTTYVKYSPTTEINDVIKTINNIRS